MIAPAIIPSSKPKALPIPRSATPTVATVVQLLPVAMDTTALTMQAAMRNIVGFKICKP